MSKIMFSGIAVTDGRGREGNYVYFRNRGGACRRTYASPVVIPNQIGLDFRQAYLSATILWQTIDEWMRQEWIQAANEIKRTNSVGHQYLLSGYNYFISQSTAILVAQGVPSLLPVAPGTITQPFSITIQTLSPAVFTVNVILSNGTGFVLPPEICWIRCSLGVSPGINFKKTGIILVDPFDSSRSLTTGDIYHAYSTAIGIPVSGLKIFVSAQVYSSITGQRSVQVFDSAIVS